MPSAGPNAVPIAVPTAGLAVVPTAAPTAVPTTVPPTPAPTVKQDVLTVAVHTTERTVVVVSEGEQQGLVSVGGGTGMYCINYVDHLAPKNTLSLCGQGSAAINSIMLKFPDGNFQTLMRDAVDEATAGTD